MVSVTEYSSSLDKPKSCVLLDNRVYSVVVDSNEALVSLDSFSKLCVTVPKSSVGFKTVRILF